MAGRTNSATLRFWVARAAWPASLVFLGVLPVVVLIVLFASAVEGKNVAIDFRPLYWAAESIVADENPYPPEGALLTASGGPYVYPPLPALLAIPLTSLSIDAAGLVVMGTLVLVALAIPFVLGVRDWRCYGLVLLWPPVISAIQTGNVTLWIALAAAIGWRARDRERLASAAVGLTLSIKFLLWPLALWLAATRRGLGAALAGVIGVLVLVMSWAAIGFDGLSEYPDLLRRLEDAVGRDSYTLYNVALDLGAPVGVARTLWLSAGLAILAAVLAMGRRGKERGAFILALAAALALSPLVWLHYFALLIVVTAIARPTLGIVWFVPLVMYALPGSGGPSAIGRVVGLVAAAAMIVLALRAQPAEDRPRAERGGDTTPRLFPALPSAERPV
jgi:alpha-1,2-mannosyltransferase